MRWAWLGLCALLWTGVARAQAQPPTAAEAASRQAFERGLAELRLSHWAEAEREFRRSLALASRPSAQYDLAFVLFKQGRMRESAECLQQLLQRAGAAADPPYRDSAAALLSQVLSQLAMLYIAVEPAHAELRVDGELVAFVGPTRALPVDPGPHRIHVSAPGFVARTLDVWGSPQAALHQVVRLTEQRPEPAAAPALALTQDRSSIASTGAWVGIGLGAALLIAAAVSFGQAQHADHQFRDRCPSLRACDPALRPTRDKVVRLRTAAEVLTATGATLVLAGSGWQLFAGASTPPARQLSLLRAKF